MNYLRTFYPQSENIEVYLQFKKGALGSGATFGLSGDTVLNFSVENGFIEINDTFCSSLDEDGIASFTVCGSNNNITVWENGRPIINPLTTGFSFNSVFCTYDSGSVFQERVLGQQPGISHSFTGWNEALKSGDIFIFNSGDSPLTISSALLEKNYVRTSFSGIEIASNSSGNIPLIYENNSPFSGLGFFTLETDAGQYSFSQDFNCNFPNDYEFLEITFDNSIEFPSGHSNFYISNKGTQDLTVELFLDFDSKQAFPTQVGYATYPTGESGYATFDYSGSGFYKKVIGVAAFQIDHDESVIGGRSLPTSYDCDFTGVGGRLNATAVQNKDGNANFTLFAGGEIIYSYEVPSSSIILDATGYATATGNLTGFVGPGSGTYHFLENIEVVIYPNTATLIDGTVIYPSSTDIFSGTVNASIAATGQVSGSGIYYAFEDVYVYEGQGDFLDFWAMDYNDVDRGLEDFLSLGRLTSSGFGVTGVTYRIPASSTTSGQVRYLSDYDNPIFQNLVLRVTDYNSVDRALSINC